MSGFLKRWVIEIEDILQFAAPIRRALSWRLQRQAGAIYPQDDQRRVARVAKLSAAARLIPPGKSRTSVEQRIRTEVDAIGGGPIDWAAFAPWTEYPQLYTAAILKPWVSPREKGVLIISFERQWIKLLMEDRRRRLSERYTLVLASSWTPPHGVGVTVFPKLYPDPVLCTISHDDDMLTLPRLSERVIPVPLLASNWVNPAAFSPLPQADRDVDIVMVATFGKYKRHHALLRALTGTPASLRVLLIGTKGHDLDADGIRALARAYGVENRLVDAREEDYPGTAKAFCRSKISVVMSRREGSCQAVVESMFADTPAGILANAELGSRKYVNDSTGALLRESHLSEDIMRLLERAPSMSPRRWVMEQDISCHGSTRILNQILRDHARSTGQDWTQDIALHAWTPYPALVGAEDMLRMRVAYQDVYERSGLQIGPDAAQWTR
jgi:glycosyltransferase involved in cell wall biosynthesis